MLLTGMRLQPQRVIPGYFLHARYHHSPRSRLLQAGHASMLVCPHADSALPFGERSVGGPGPDVERIAEYTHTHTHSMHEGGKGWEH